MRVVARLGNSPGHAALPAVLDLPADDGVIGAVEQRVLVGGHHQQRHQVLEHRAAPAQQRRRAARARQQTAQREPMLLAEIALGDHDEARQPRFGRQQIVKARIEPPLADVVANGEQVARRSRTASRNPCRPVRGTARRPPRTSESARRHAPQKRPAQRSTARASLSSPRALVAAPLRSAAAPSLRRPRHRAAWQRCPGARASRAAGPTRSIGSPTVSSQILPGEQARRAMRPGAAGRPDGRCRTARRRSPTRQARHCCPQPAVSSAAPTVSRDQQGVGGAKRRGSLVEIFDLPLDLAQHVGADQRPVRAAGHVQQHAQRIAQAAEHSRRQDRRLAQFRAAAGEHQQIRRQIAAIDRRNIAGMQGRERSRVVPVEEMPAIALHARQRVKGVAACDVSNCAAEQ